MKLLIAILSIASISSTVLAKEVNIGFKVASQTYSDDPRSCGEGRARAAIMVHLVEDDTLNLETCRVVANGMDPLIFTANEYICVGYVGVVCETKK